MERLHNLDSASAFLGLVGYYRRFIKNFVKIAHPIDDLFYNNKNKPYN